MSYIPEFESGLLLEVWSFTNHTFFWCSIIMSYLSMYWIGITVPFLTASYVASWRKTFFCDCWLSSYHKTNLVSSVLVTCISICAIVRCDILLISSTLYPEDTWRDASHEWVFVFKLGGLGVGGRGRFIFTYLSLIVFYMTHWMCPLLPPRHSSCGKIKTFLSYTSASTQPSPHFWETSV